MKILKAIVPADLRRMRSPTPEPDVGVTNGFWNLTSAHFSTISTTTCYCVHYTTTLTANGYCCTFSDGSRLRCNWKAGANWHATKARRKAV